MKAGAVYESRSSGRQWRLFNGQIETRGQGDEIWHLSGWPQPTMFQWDIDYYIKKGDFIEIE